MYTGEMHKKGRGESKGTGPKGQETSQRPEHLKDRKTRNQHRLIQNKLHRTGNKSQ